MYCHKVKLITWHISVVHVWKRTYDKWSEVHPNGWWSERHNWPHSFRKHTDSLWAAKRDPLHLTHESIPMSKNLDSTNCHGNFCISISALSLRKIYWIESLILFYTTKISWSFYFLMKLIHFVTFTIKTLFQIIKEGRMYCPKIILMIKSNAKILNRHMICLVSLRNGNSTLETKEAGFGLLRIFGIL